MKLKDRTIIDKFQTVGGKKFLEKLLCPNCETYQSMGSGKLHRCKLIPETQDEHPDGHIWTDYGITAPQPCLFLDRVNCPLIKGTLL